MTWRKKNIFAYSASELGVNFENVTKQTVINIYQHPRATGWQ